VLHDYVHLVLGFAPPAKITKFFRFAQVLPQIVQPAFVLCLRLCVQHWTRVRESGSDQLILQTSQASSRGDFRSRNWSLPKAGDQFADVELASGIAKQHS
jgi:hypothetical protein